MENYWQSMKLWRSIKHKKLSFLPQEVACKRGNSHTWKETNSKKFGLIPKIFWIWGWLWVCNWDWLLTIWVFFFYSQYSLWLLVVEGWGAFILLHKSKGILKIFCCKLALCLEIFLSFESRLNTWTLAQVLHTNLIFKVKLFCSLCVKKLLCMLLYRIHVF